MQFMILGSHADKRVGWSIKPQNFFYGAVDQFAIRFQFLQLVWMTQQEQRGVADQVRGRLMACEQNKNAGCHQFVMAQHVTVFARVDQIHEKALLGIFGVFLDQRGKIGRHLLTSARGTLVLVF